MPACPHPTGVLGLLPRGRNHAGVGLALPEGHCMPGSGVCWICG